jgi:hypothetical protein
MTDWGCETTAQRAEPQLVDHEWKDRHRGSSDGPSQQMTHWGAHSKRQAFVEQHRHCSSGTGGSPSTSAPLRCVSRGRMAPLPPTAPMKSPHHREALLACNGRDERGRLAGLNGAANPGV